MSKPSPGTTPSQSRRPSGGHRVSRPSPLQLGALGALVVGVVYVYAVNQFIPVDAYGYLAAGERLNAGHPLYSISPGDRTLLPEMISYVLLYPPPIAVVWRPLAALGSWTVYAWWLIAAAVALGTAVFVVAARPVAGSIALIALFAGVAFLSLIGSFNAFILGAGAGAWYLGRASRWNLAAVMLGLVVAIKPIAIPLLLWAAVRGTGRWRAIPGAAAGLGVGLGIGLFAGGPSVYVEWLNVALSNAGAPQTGLSPAHLAPWLPAVILGVGVVCAIWLPTTAAYVIAVIATALGHPSANAGSIALLILIALAAGRDSWASAVPTTGSAGSSPDPGPE